MLCAIAVFACKNLTSTNQEYACLALQGLLKTLSIFAQSTIAHAVKKLSKDRVVDKSENDGSYTGQDVASALL